VKLSELISMMTRVGEMPASRSAIRTPREAMSTVSGCSLTLMFYGALHLLGSLVVVGSLMRNGSLLKLGALRLGGSLALSGALRGFGSLVVLGALGWYGSLRMLGALDWFGPLAVFGALGTYGSLKQLVGVRRLRQIAFYTASEGVEALRRQLKISGAL
jgi:hypothetical protein